MHKLIAVLLLLLTQAAHADSKWWSIVDTAVGTQLQGLRGSLIVSPEGAVSGWFRFVDTSGNVVQTFPATIDGHDCKAEHGDIAYSNDSILASWSLEGTKMTDFEGAILCGGYGEYLKQHKSS